MPTNGPHAYAAKFALSLYRSNSVFTFVPKNACSTMRFSIAVDNGFLQATDSINWIHRNNPTFVATQSELVRADYTFVILRCPYERLLSVFFDKIADVHPDAWVFRNEGSPKGHPASASFTDFVAEVTTDRKIHENLHWRPQIDHLVYSDYDDYFSFRRLDDMAKRVKEKIDFDIVDARPLTKHGSGELERVEGDFAATPAYEIAAMKRAGRVPSVASIFTEQSIELIRRHYAADIDLYRAKTGDECLF